ncbi:uncharacterized protein BJ212DRAFT_944477 [Suillus subaureus]|uniref:Uncharacterized protein n=1 Tax=Suillus subaureus TaxID=48587 RepID=A0A9P7DVR1_9AGAM|nr:uncharacterized protein BJ212DRAFT_944477 [Suillus subaureus]KAG1804114.1 hypothetical protein BJ212DRAFT_944477 [Suillus subaureus]
MTPPPSYQFPAAPMSGIASGVPPTGEARQTVPQRHQQYYTTMSPPSHLLMTASIPSIGGSHPFIFASSHCPSTGQAYQTIQQPTEQHYTTAPPTAVNMVSRLARQSSTIPLDNQPAAPGYPDYHYYSNTMSSLESRHFGQTDFSGLSTPANHWERSFAPPSRTPITTSSNDNAATSSFGFAAGPSSHVANMSVDAAINSSDASNGSEAASAAYFSTHKNHTQSNDAMIDNTTRPRFPTTTCIPSNDFIPLMPSNAPGPQTTYTHPPATNMNKFTVYGPPFHNPPSLHSAQYHTTVIGNNLPPSSLPTMPYLAQHVPPNTGFAPPGSYLKSSHDFGTQHNSQPAGPPYQPAPFMVPSPPIYPRPDPPHRNSLSRPSSGRRRKPHTQETQPSPLFCDWLNEDNKPCGFAGLPDDLNEHFTSSHLLSGAQNALGRCRWRGCQYRKRTDPNVHDMRRDSMSRHVREKHLKIKRRM